jgi:hypothetical protein
VKSLTAILLILSLTASAQKVYLTKRADGGAVIPAVDTVVISSTLNPWTWIYVNVTHPVVIINEGQVEMTAGFHFYDAVGPKIKGSEYGFKITSGGAAIAIEGKSAKIDVSGVWVSGATFGVWCKNEASCDQSVNDWVMDSISIHDNRFENIAIEGMYLGSTDPNNLSRPVTCNGVVSNPKPTRLGNFKIYNNIIDGTGRPAIMLSNARVGSSEIYGNIISNVGREYNDQQGTGISIGGYTRAYVHHNTVTNTFTWGIASLGGSGLVRIENNTITGSGVLDGRVTNYPAIYLDTRYTDPVDPTTFSISSNQANNVVVGNTFGNYTAQNTICGNVTATGQPTTVTIAPGVPFTLCRALPVRLISFTAQKSGQSVLLSWKAEESNLQHYEIERSGNGTNWQRIGKLHAGQPSYQLLDLIPLPVTFYRLKIVEANGTHSYSPVRVVHLYEPLMNVEVYDRLGRLLEKRVGYPAEVKYNLKPGFYILKYWAGKFLKTEKYLK